MATWQIVNWNISIYCSDGWTLKKYLIIYLILQQDIFFKFHSKNIPKLKNVQVISGSDWQCHYDLDFMTNNFDIIWKLASDVWDTPHTCNWGKQADF